MNKDRLIYIIGWRDSRMYLQQCSGDADFDVEIIESCGYLIEENEKHIVLAGDLIETDIRRVLVIPRENILKIETK